MANQHRTKRKQLDLILKKLLNHNDVFADIVNAVLFRGEEMVKPEDLRNVQTTSMYKGEGKLNSMDRDIAKYWVKGNMTLCLLGAENQTRIDPDMIFRNIGYDGTAYRDQMNHGKERYPVITFVVYCGDKPWNKPLTLYETLGNIPEGLKRYVNDYRMNLIDVKRMGQDELDRLKSDFWHIVKTIQESKRSNYEPDDTRPIKYGDEVSEFMSEYTGNSYSGAVQSLRKKHERITMKSLLSEAEKKEILEKNTEDVTKKVTAEVTVKNSAAHVLNLMETVHFSYEEAVSALKIPSELQEAVLEEVRRLS